MAAVSHELRTPLASMRLLVETLIEDEQPDIVKTREYLTLIAGENLRLTRTWSKTSSRSRGSNAIASASNSARRGLLAIVDAALAAMRVKRLHAPGCHLDVELSPGLPTVLADQDALTTMLVNLLDNACKYTPAEKRIRVRAYHDNGCLAFDVEDNGIGIAPRDQKRIFRRFYQVDRRPGARNRRLRTGVEHRGNSLCAHMECGEVDVESRPGAGSTFHVRLPCHPVAKEAVA